MRWSKIVKNGIRPSGIQVAHTVQTSSQAEPPSALLLFVCCGGNWRRLSRLLLFLLPLRHCSRVRLLLRDHVAHLLNVGLRHGYERGLSSHHLAAVVNMSTSTSVEQQGRSTHSVRSRGSGQEWERRCRGYNKRLLPYTVITHLPSSLFPPRRPSWRSP